MQQRMRHPEHGAAHAYSDGEMRELMARGFVPEDESGESAEEDAQAVGASVSGEASEVATGAPAKRRGRPSKVK